MTFTPHKTERAEYAWVKNKETGRMELKPTGRPALVTNQGRVEAATKSA